MRLRVFTPRRDKFRHRALWLQPGLAQRSATSRHLTQRFCRRRQASGIRDGAVAARLQNVMRRTFRLRFFHRGHPLIPVVGIDLRVLLHAAQRHVG